MITWTYDDAISLVPGEYVAVLREDADATIEHLTRVTLLLDKRLGGVLSIEGLAGLELTASDALDLLEQYPNRPQPTTPEDIDQVVGMLDIVRRLAMVKIHQQEVKLHFNHGAVWACARLVELHDQPTMAADVLLQARLSSEDLARLPEYDLEFLRNDSARQHIPAGVE